MTGFLIELSTGDKDRNKVYMYISRSFMSYGLSTVNNKTALAERQNRAEIP